MDNINREELGHGIAYVWGSMIAWIERDGRKVGKTYRGETAWMDAERDAIDMVMTLVFG